MCRGGEEAADARRGGVGKASGERPISSSVRVAWCDSRQGGDRNLTGWAALSSTALSPCGAVSAALLVCSLDGHPRVVEHRVIGHRVGLRQHARHLARGRPLGPQTETGARRACPAASLTAHRSTANQVADAANRPRYPARSAQLHGGVVEPAACCPPLRYRAARGPHGDARDGKASQGAGRALALLAFARLLAPEHPLDQPGVCAGGEGMGGETEGVCAGRARGRGGDDPLVAKRAPQPS
eukprot:scaffold4566_cov118-Isochrysis_galbana.AAC.2